MTGFSPWPAHLPPMVVYDPAAAAVLRHLPNCPRLKLSQLRATQVVCQKQSVVIEVLRLPDGRLLAYSTTTLYGFLSRCGPAEGCLSSPSSTTTPTGP